MRDSGWGMPYTAGVTASTEPCHQAYREILGMARRFTHSEDEARDLVQDAVMLALARGFDDWSTPARRGWLWGLVRKRAAFMRRGQARRRRREQLPDGPAGSHVGSWVWREDFLASLPRSLRVVAALASAELCAAEIRWLLGLSDTALRQRLTALRRAVRAAPEQPTHARIGRQLALGPRRAELLAGLRRQQGRVVATHDPDGHVILLRIVPHKPGLGGNLLPKETSCPSPT
jgi:DNA-directed RNA polymerase specialized sigma24 family protein